ncbi:VP1 [Micromonas pusilla reovirus]|uniref:Uncharacterized protein VP1 n=1 Tax=Micromonas pusilla reovirus (isolate Netherlands/2005) TaxID=649596 RepID=VP1_MPRVN|nr:VP1 [Micromonas pusilla reovirus]Q1I0V1.1 RecName: Full=Uncharacterized protein VP1 [Micromonas pusilla reovirus (isolate Netherlands)]AAZ94041.1 VP1 [Micromonas pusilla reovirus]
MDNVISNIQTSLHEVHGRFETSGLNLTSLTSRVSALESGIDEDFSGQLSLKADKNEVAKFTSNSNVVTSYSVSQLGAKINNLEISDDNLQSSKVNKTRVSIALDDNGNDISDYTLSQEGLGNKLKVMDNEIGLRALTSRIASFTRDGVLTNLSSVELGARLIATESNADTRALKSEVSSHTDAENVTTTYGVTSLGAELHRIAVAVNSLDTYVLKTEVSRLESNGVVVPEYTLTQTELGAKLKNIVDSISNFVVNTQVSKNYDEGTLNYELNAYTLSDYELGAMLERFDTTHLLKSQVSKRYVLNADGSVSNDFNSDYTLSDFELGTKLFDIDTLLNTKISGEEVSINTSDPAYTLNQSELGTLLKTLTGRIDLVSPADADSSIFALKTSVSTHASNTAYTLSTTALATKLESMDSLLSSHGTLIDSKASISNMNERALQSRVSLKFINNDGVTIDEKFTCSVLELGSLLFNMDAATEAIARNYVTDEELAAAVATAVATTGALTSTSLLTTTVSTITKGGSSVVRTAADLARAVFGGGDSDDDDDPPPPVFIYRSEGIFRPANWGSDGNVDGYSRPMIEGRENIYASDGTAQDLHSYIINLVAGNAKVFYRDVSYTSKIRLLGSSGSADDKAAQYGPPASTSYFFPAPASLATVEAGLSWGSSTTRTQSDGTTLSGYTGGIHVLSCFGTSRFEGRSESRKVVWLTGAGTAASSTLDAKLAFDGTGGDAPIHVFGESTTKYGLDLHDAGLVMRNSQSNAKIDIKYHSSNLVFASLTPNVIPASPDILESILTIDSSANSVGIAGGASSQYKLYVHGGANFTSGITSSSASITGNNNSIPSLSISNTTVGAKKEFKMSTDQDGLIIEYGTATSGVVVMDTRISMNDTFTTVDSVGTNSGLEVVGKLGNKASMVLRHMPNSDNTKGTITLGRYLSIKTDLDASRLYTGYTSLDATELIYMDNSNVIVKGDLSVSGNISLIDTSVTPNTTTNIVSGISTALGRVSTLINGGDLSMLRPDGTSIVVRAANIESIGHPAYTVTDEQGVVTSVERTGLFLRPDSFAVDDQIDARLTSVGLTEGDGNENNPLTLNVYTIPQIDGIIAEGHVAGSVSRIIFSSSETLGSRTFPSVAITPINNPFITNATITNTIVGIKRVTVSGNSNEQGSGYVAGDTITISDSFGTGTNAVFTVVNASSGGVDGGSTSLTITNPGAYTSISGTPIVIVEENPTYPAVTGITQQSSSGSGTGVTFSVELSVISVDIFNAGKGYVTSPSVVVSGTYVDTVSNTTTTSGIQSAVAVLHTTSNVTVLDSRFSKAATLSISNTATQLTSALNGYVSTSDLGDELANYYNIDEIVEGFAPIAAPGETYAYLSTTSLENYQTRAASNILYQAKETADNAYIRASDLTASGTGFYDKTTSDERYQAQPASGESFALASSLVNLVDTSTTALTNYSTTNEASTLYQAKEDLNDPYVLRSTVSLDNYDTTTTINEKIAGVSSHFTKSGNNITYNYAGNVGIGGTPNTKLEVYGSIQALPITDTSCVFGNARVGGGAYAGYAHFTHAAINPTHFGNYALLQYSSGHTFLNCSAGSGVGLSFRKNNADWMEYQGNGLLYVTSGNTRYISYIGFQYNPSGLAAGIMAGTGNIVVSMKVLYAIECQRILVVSDERVKTNIRDVNDHEALDIIRLIKPKKFEYIDKESAGPGTIYGFIAQDIIQHVPECVKKGPGVIANIMDTARVCNGRTLIFERFDTSNLKGVNGTIQVLDVDGKNHDVIVETILDSRTVIINKDLSAYTGSVDENGVPQKVKHTTTLTQSEYDAYEDKSDIVKDGDTYTRTEYSNVGDNVFVRGEHVDDFHTMDKDHIIAITTAALQEIDRQLQLEKAKVISLESRLSALELKFGV